MSTERGSGATTELADSNRELLIRALMEFSGRSRGQIEGFLADKSDDELHSIRDSPNVKLIFERLQSERGSHE